MLLGQGPERYLCLYPEYQGTLYHLAHPGRYCVTGVPLDRLHCYLQFESCPQGCCLSHFVAQGTLGYLLHRRLTMAMSLYPGGLYLGSVGDGFTVLICCVNPVSSSIMSSVSKLVSSGFTLWIDREHVLSSHFRVLVVYVPYFVLFLHHLFYYHAMCSCGFTVFFKKIHTVPRPVLSVSTFSQPVLVLVVLLF